MRQYAAKSDYKYIVHKSNESVYILIKDLNLGRMSVTNNIENIIEQICFDSKLDPSTVKCIYKDSD